MKLDLAFPRNSDGRSTLFPVEEEPTRLVTSSPFPNRPVGRKPSPVDHLLPPTGGPLLKAATGSAGPLSPSRTLTHVHSAPSATVKQEKPDTARRASDDSATSGQINRSMLLSKAEESQLSPSRTGSEPPAPLGLRQGPSWAARAPSVHFSPMSDGPTRPGSVGPDSSRAPGVQLTQSSTLPAPQILTDASAPSVFDPKLEYSTEQVVLLWQPPSCFS